MTVSNWPHGPETLKDHLTRVSTYIHRKRKPDIAGMTAVTYALYLHYKTETGYHSDLYEDLSRPLKNKIHQTLGLSGVISYGKNLIETIQKDLNIVVEK